MLHKYCLQNRNIFCSINSRLQLFFFFFFYLYKGLTVLTLIKNPFLKKKFEISYSNLTLLLNFFYGKKKKLLPHKTLSTKNRTTLPVHLRWFLYLYYYLSILLFKGLPLFGFLIFIVLKSPYISMFK